MGNMEKLYTPTEASYLEFISRRFRGGTEREKSSVIGLQVESEEFQNRR